MSLAISIAFSSPSHGMIETTGPKISSCAMRILGSTSANTVGATNQPWLYASPSRRCPPHNIFAPSSLPILMYFRSVSIWLELTAGPMSTLSSSPLPTFSFFARATNSSTNFLYTPFWMMMRLVAVQRWPVVPNAPHSAPSSARSRLASSSTIIGFLPPSSSEQCLNVLAASCPTMRRSEEHTSELQSPCNLVCRLLLEKKKKITQSTSIALPHTQLVYHQ